MNHLEKPSKTKRKKQEKRIKEQAREYRQRQRNWAIFRDDKLCTACYFLDKKIRKAQDVHHVYGRAVTKNVLTDKKESFTSLLCLCREHHDAVVIIREGSNNWVEDILEKANNYPINEAFKSTIRELLDE